MLEGFRITRLVRALRLLGTPELSRRLLHLYNEERAHLEATRQIEGTLHPDAVVLGGAHGRLQVARGARVERGTLLALGDELNGFGEIRVGENAWIGEYNNVRVSAGGSVEIGPRCLVSQYCTLIAANHDLSGRGPIAGRPCMAGTRVVLGPDVWLGAGASVMPGSVIGQGAVIGAGAVVTCAVPEFEIWAGVPARKVGERG